MSTPAQPRTGSFHHNRRNLVFDVYGPDVTGPDPGRDVTGPDPGRAPVVVYTHGLLLDSEVNRGIAGALAAAGNTVVLLDLLGHGRSDRPTHASEYRIDSYADQVVALLDHLGVDRAVLGGISLGANVSLFAGTAFPERVAGLVLEMPVLEWAVPAAALAFAPLLLTHHYAGAATRLVAAGLSRLPRTSFGPLNSILNSGSMPPEVAAAVLHGVLVGPVAPTTEARSAITAPTLVLAHRNDLIHPFDDAAALVRQLPNARLVRARSPLELRLRPRRLSAEIVEFVAGTATPSPAPSGAAGRERTTTRKAVSR